LAARDTGVPFYVALPSSTIDRTVPDGAAVPIEERSPDEVRYVDGLGDSGPTRVLVVPEKSPARNPAFDVTPVRLVTGFITDVAANALGCRGPVAASSESLSHAAVYAAEPAAAAVIHVHHLGLWEELRDVLPTTDSRAEAGKPAMADAITALLRADVPGGVFVM